MTDCIRRARSYWTTCRCDDCIRDRSRKRKQQSMGIIYRYPNDQAWELLAQKIDAGWTSRALGSATQLGPDYFDRHVAGHRQGRRIYLVPAAAAAIMNMGVPTEGQIGAEPSRRRLRALAATGYGLNTISTETGIRFSTLAAIRNKAERIGASLALEIAATYKRLHMTPGSDEQAVRIAREKRWASPLAWDDIDMDSSPADPGTDATPDRIDEATVLRVLAGENLPTNRAEKTEIMRRWLAAGRSERSLCERMGWRDGRYTTRNQEAS